MMLSSYLCPSRHGVYYFRWPIPSIQGQSRRTVRISLGTKCPNDAGDLARYLAVCGKLLRDNKALARLRQDEIRSFVHGYFVRSPERHRHTMNSKGFSQRSIDAFKEELVFHEERVEGFDDMSDQLLDGHLIERSKEFARLDENAWVENEPDLRRELRKGRRDLLFKILSAVGELEHYSLDRLPELAVSHPSLALTASTSLGSGIADFLEEQSRQWAAKTTKQNQAYLNVMLEYFGAGKPLAEITKKDASALKKVRQNLPSSRNTKPALEGLPLMQVINAEGHNRISPKTINSHIQMFASFFDWAERHGHAKEKLFAGMKVAKAKHSADVRKPFTLEQTQLIYKELTANTSGLARNDSHKWGMLLGMFTGARVKGRGHIDMEMSGLHISKRVASVYDGLKNTLRGEFYDCLQDIPMLRRDTTHHFLAHKTCLSAA